MADRPEPLKGFEIRALLDGSKTQTRRVLCHDDDNFDPPYVAYYEEGARAVWCDPRDSSVHGFPRAAGSAVGDRLWVRERLARDPHLWKYVADGSEVGWPGRRGLASRVRDYLPSIHMPKDCSRLTLIVIDVRVQRVQEISEDDAIAEGIERVNYDGEIPEFQSAWGWRDYSDHPHAVVPFHHEKPILSFRSRWNSLNAGRGYGWDVNPWVVAVTFDVHRCNIDAMEKAA